MRFNPGCHSAEPGWNGAERSAKSEQRMRRGMEHGFRQSVRQSLAEAVGDFASADPVPLAHVAAAAKIAVCRRNLKGREGRGILTYGG